MSEMIGDEIAQQVRDLSIRVYSAAATLAEQKGIILADTKFEWGIEQVEESGVITNRLVLIDEVLTPDSSRFWPRDQYQVGKSQPSLDKQIVRDWLKSEGLDGKEPVEIPYSVMQAASEKYDEILQILTQS